MIGTAKEVNEFDNYEPFILVKEVHYTGTGWVQVEHDAFEDQIESYYIVEWYPVYPILRDTILPNWMYPKDFMTKREVK